MNAAAFCSGVTVDLFNLYLKESSEAIQQRLVGQVQLSPNRLVLLATCAVYLLALATTFLFIREIQITSLSSSLSLTLDRDIEMNQFTSHAPVSTNPSGNPLHPDTNCSSTHPLSPTSSSSSSPAAAAATNESSYPYLVPEHSSPTPSALSFNSPTLRRHTHRYSYTSNPINSNHNPADSCDSTASSHDPPLSPEAGAGPADCTQLGLGLAVCEQFLPQSLSPWQTALQMGRSPAFWRFCLLSLLLVDAENAL